MDTRFKTGDRVKVVDPHGLMREGDVYTVTDTSGTFVWLSGLPAGMGDGGWLNRRFRKVEDMATIATSILDKLQVGDVMLSGSGRTYTVTDVDPVRQRVSYAFIPAHATTTEIRIDTRQYSELHWVERVKRGAQTLWPSDPTVGDTVVYDGLEWMVNKVTWIGNLRLERTETAVVDPNEVEVV